MKKKFLAVMSAAAVFAFTFCGCYNIADSTTAYAAASSSDTYSMSIYSFGTEANFTIYGDFGTEEEQQKAVALYTEVKNFLTELESELDAAIEKFNAADAGEIVEIGEKTYTILSLALELYKETGGYYNAGVYSLVDLFGFSSRFNTYTYSAVYKEEYDRTYTATDSSGNQVVYATASQLPDTEYITAFTELATTFGDIILDSTNYTATKPKKTVTVNGTEYSLKIDLGGIAKGYASDKIGEMMAEAGYTCGYFSFGSSSMSIASYKSGDGNFTLSIRNPRDISSYYTSIRTSNTTVSTSGDYERAYSFYDVNFCHIINPYTGLPVNVEYSDGEYSQTAGIISATIIGGSAAENDARTTAVMAMGIENAVSYLANFSDLQFMLVVNKQDISESQLSALKSNYYLHDSGGTYAVLTNIENLEVDDNLLSIGVESNTTLIIVIVVCCVVVAAVLVVAIVYFYRKRKTEKK